MLWRILNYRPGSMFWIGLGLAVFLGTALVTQYRVKGRLDLRSMVDRGADTQYFWDRNPNLEFRDSYVNTGLVVGRDRESGREAMLDLVAVMSAQVAVRACSPEPVLVGAEDVVCVAIRKPDTGAGTDWVRGVSFQARVKSSAVGQFYRELFARRGWHTSVMQDSSRALILEAEDARGDTVARVAIRGVGDSARAFVAMTAGFD